MHQIQKLHRLHSGVKFGIQFLPSVPHVSNIIWGGGDFNCCLSLNNADGGKYKPKVKSVAEIQSIIEDFDLCDIWRIHNPENKQYTWRTFSPKVQRRLDYIFLSGNLQFLTSSIKIKDSVQTDHILIIVELHSNGK